MAAGDPLLVLAPAAGLSANCACHLLVTRLTNGRRLTPGVLLGIGAGAVAAVSCTVVSVWNADLPTAEPLVWVAYNLLIYLALAYGYFNFFNLNIASLRLRILAELLASDHGLTRSKLMTEYNPAELLDKRLSRLIRLHQLVERDGRLHYEGTALLWLARVLNQLKRHLLGRTNRFSKAFERSELS